MAIDAASDLDGNGVSAFLTLSSDGALAGARSTVPSTVAWGIMSSGDAF